MPSSAVEKGMSSGHSPPHLSPRRRTFPFPLEPSVGIPYRPHKKMILGVMSRAKYVRAHDFDPANSRPIDEL